MGYPIGRRNTVTVINSVKHFAGRRKIKQVYSDDAPEFINACSELKIPHGLSLPGKRQNNSLAERTNQFIVDQTTACLVHAGLPTCCWIYAITALCHLMNVEEINGSSAWFRLHGEHFKGEKIPCGALVEFRPSDAKGDKREKFEPKGETGIFAGYNLSSGLTGHVEPGLSQASPALTFLQGRRKFHLDYANRIRPRGSCSSYEYRFPFRNREIKLLKELRRFEGKMAETSIWTKRLRMKTPIPLYCRI